MKKQFKNYINNYSNKFKIFRDFVSLTQARNYPNSYHLYHIVSRSVWPFTVALAVGFLGYSLVYWFYTGFMFLVFFALIEIVIITYFWWSDISWESGEHTLVMSTGLKIGMLLFIASEVMFFFSFFWSFFQVSIIPGHELGNVWPPVSFITMCIDPWDIPILNTILLLSSGVTITCAHHCFLCFFSYEQSGVVLSSSIFFSNIYSTNLRLLFSREFVLSSCLIKFLSICYFVIGVELFLVTICLALIFTILQCSEYVESLIRISDSVYGSTFFVMTGFHGLHVLIGSIFLIVCLCRLLLNQFYYKHSAGLECSIWYWHFVDVVWIFLFICLYVWGVSGVYNSSLLEDKIDPWRMYKILFGSLFSSRSSRTPIFNVIDSDFARHWQTGFQDPATVLMESIIDFHHTIMAYLIFIFVIVIWVFWRCLEDKFDIDLKRDFNKILFFRRIIDYLYDNYYNSVVYVLNFIIDILNFIIYYINIVLKYCDIIYIRLQEIYDECLLGLRILLFELSFLSFKDQVLFLINDIWKFVKVVYFEFFWSGCINFYLRVRGWYNYLIMYVLYDYWVSPKWNLKISIEIWQAWKNFVEKILIFLIRLYKRFF